MHLPNALVACSNLYVFYALYRYSIFKHGPTVFVIMPLAAAFASFCYHWIESPPLPYMNHYSGNTSKEEFAWYITDLTIATPTFFIGLYCFIRVLQLQRDKFGIPMLVGCKRHAGLLSHVVVAFYFLVMSEAMRDFPHSRQTYHTVLYIIAHALWHSLAYDAYYKTLDLYRKHIVSAALSSKQKGE